MLEQHRYKAPLKVPHNMAQIIAVNKPVLKAIAIYLELKPLYYSGVIKNAKARSSEVAAYLQICPRTLHARISWLKKHGFIWYDKKNNLYLCSYEKLCNKINSIFNSNLKHNKHHELSNDGLTEHCLRALAIHESRLKQQEAAKAKVFSKEKYDERVFFDIQYGIVPNRAWAPYHQDVTRYTYLNKKLRREKRNRLAYYTPSAPARGNLLTKYEKLYKFRMSSGDDAEINPHYTLSCKGVASLLTGTDAPSNGHYWEQRLCELGFLNVKPHHIRLERTSGYYQQSIQARRGYYDPITHKRKAMYARPGKDRFSRSVFFRVLPNHLLPLLNMHQNPTGVQLRLVI